MNNGLENKNIWDGSTEFPKSLYEQYIEKIELAIPTKRQMFIGYFCFWVLVALSFLFVLSMAYASTDKVVFSTYVFWYSIIILFLYVQMFCVANLLHVHWGTRRNLFSGINGKEISSSDRLWEVGLNYSYSFTDKKIMNIFFSENTIHKKIYLYIMSYNYVKINYIIGIIPTMIIITLTFFILFLALIFEETGVYIDIRPYILITDFFPDIWKYNNASNKDSFIGFLNTIYIILYFGLCILGVFTLYVYSCAVSIWYRALQAMRHDRKTVPIIWSYLRKYPVERSWKLIIRETVIIFGLIFCFYLLCEGIFREKPSTFFLRTFDFSNSIYPILSSVWLFLGAFFVMFCIVHSTQRLVEFNYYRIYFKGR